MAELITIKLNIKELGPGGKLLLKLYPTTEAFKREFISKFKHVGYKTWKPIIKTSEYIIDNGVLTIRIGVQSVNDGITIKDYVTDKYNTIVAKVVILMIQDSGMEYVL